MYATSSEPEIVKELLAKAKSYLAELIVMIESESKETLLHATTDFYSESDRRGKLYIITEGNLFWRWEDNSIYILEAGDLLGANEWLGTPIGTYSTEFAVHYKEFEAANFFAAIYENEKAFTLWSKYNIALNAAMSAFSMELIKGDKDVAPVVSNFQPGQTIIEQGSIGNEVYSLIEGGAEIFVDGIKVGEINTDAIFGAFAALTGNPRSATIVASKESMAFVLDKDNFLELFNTRPAAVHKMVEDMAQAILALNKKIVELTGKLNKDSLIT